jgi:hypothetical protein
MITRATILLGLWFMLCSFNALGKSFDLLLMPGQVIRGHAEFEEKCDDCHVTLEKENQSRLCVSCHDHEDIAKDVEQSQGFHGRIDNIRETSCSHCHTDHEGRDAEVVLFDPESFDHVATDFKLDGAHIGVKCEGCHRPEKKYSQAPGNCIDCHKEDDPHKERLGEKCADCHITRDWAENEFDHDKTEFQLEGKHVEVDCKLCHAGEVYKKTPKECIACHQINDVHQNRYGTKCETCHVTKEWEKVRFDHDKETEFRLDGKHKKVLCDACHTGDLYEDKLKKECYACHKLDDDHKGRNGRECSKCHTSSSWKEVEFDHEQDTEFPLRGRHRELACEACHRSSMTEEKLDKTCLACHQDDDVHQGQQGESCAQCHNEGGWGEKVFFDHDLTKFPLIGQHSTVTCEECHVSSEFQETESRCNVCHDDEDVHEKRLGELCASCHTPNGWGFWFFDHNKQTEFQLQGAHEGLACHACHIKPVTDEIKLGQTCFTCHRNDDVHRSGFGRRCERCHTSESFKDIRRDKLKTIDVD